MGLASDPRACIWGALNPNPHLYRRIRQRIAPVGPRALTEVRPFFCFLFCRFLRRYRRYRTPSEQNEGVRGGGQGSMLCQGAR